MSELNKGALSPKTPSMPFMLGPYKGEATVRYSANRGVEDSGFTAIGREFTDEMVKEFPVMRATVTFSGKGHEAMFGWAQAVSHIHGDGVEKRFTVDLAPSVQGNDFPYCAVGYKPSTFDAPCNRPGPTWPGGRTRSSSSSSPSPGASPADASTRSSASCGATSFRTGARRWL